MKLLILFKDVFNELPNDIDIKNCLLSHKEQLGSETFCNIYFNQICGRSYNNFVDYGAAALKFVNYFKEIGVFNNIQGIVDSLLLDDRHDCGTNIQHYLYKILKENSLNKDSFWSNIADILIGCFNESGTGDMLINLSKWPGE